MKQDQVLVACPKCGHAQHEPATAYSSVCKKCRGYFRVEDVLRSAAEAAGPTRRPPAPLRAVRHVTCFQCGTALEVAPSAQSTMCKRCSSHLDLRDYQITVQSRKTSGPAAVLSSRKAVLFSTPRRSWRTP